MLGLLYNTILVNPIFNILLLIYALTKNLGIAIIGLTVIVKMISLPTIIPSMKSMKKQRDLQPEIQKIKSKYKYDKKKQAELQMELLKKHGVNPATGCYSMILTIFIFTALYTVINQMTLLKDLEGINARVYLPSFRIERIEDISTGFLYFDLSKPDPYFILAILAGLLQFLMAKMQMPYTNVGKEAAKETPDKTDDLAYNMQQQTMYMMPLMMVVLGVSLPAGVVLYIITSTLLSIVQNYFISGWGGLQPLVNKLMKSKGTLLLRSK